MKRSEPPESSRERTEPLLVSDVYSLSERQKAIIEDIIKVLQEEGENNLVSLKLIESNRLNECRKEINGMLEHIKRLPTSQTNNLIRAEAVVVTHNLRIS